MPSLSRYQSTNIANAPAVVNMIRMGVKNNTLSYMSDVIPEGKRLDHIAFEYYNDARLWWIIAAASNIGWWLQVPPGTRIVIPTDLNQILNFV